MFTQYFYSNTQQSFDYMYMYDLVSVPESQSSLAAGELSGL